MVESPPVQIESLAEVGQAALAALAAAGLERAVFKHSGGFSRMSVTLADISRKAGVSVTTVSKVLSGKAAPFRISKATQERIWRVARELDYAPDLQARSLRAKRSFEIGIVVSHFNDPWYGQVIHGLESVLVRNEYGFLVNSIEEDPARLTQRINRMRAHRVEGLILAGSRLELSKDMAQRLKKAGMPVILVNRRSAWPWISSLRFDHVHTGRISTQHLVDLGHRRIGMLLGPENDPGNQARVEGHRQVLHGAGQEVDEDLLEYAEPSGGFDSCRNGFVAIQRLLRRHPELTAVLAFDDSVALGAIRGATELGYHVSRDLSVVGVDDSFLAEFANPALTTVRLPTTEVGEVAAQQMLQMLSDTGKGSKTVNLEFQGTLVVRKSTSSPRAS